jgi:hypothetical protein
VVPAIISGDSRGSGDDSSTGIRGGTSFNGADGSRDKNSFSGHIGASSGAVGHGGGASGDCRGASSENSGSCELGSCGC